MSLNYTLTPISGTRYNNRINYKLIIPCFLILAKLHSEKHFRQFVVADTFSNDTNNVSYSPGADDVIAFNNDDTIYELEERDLFVKELLIRKPHDAVFLTTASSYNRDFINKFLTENGQIISTVEKRLASDDYGIAKRYLFSVSKTPFQPHPPIHLRLQLSCVLCFILFSRFM